MTNQIPQVTERNTKKEILEALSAAEALLAKKSEGSFDPVAETAIKKQVETVTKAEEVNALSSIAAITQLQRQVTDVLEKVSAQHDDTVDEFRTVQEAIKIKEEELNELYKIEVKAGTLAALIQAHTDLTEKQKAEYAEKHAEFKAELDRLDAIAKENSQHIKKAKEEAEAELKKEFKRKREEAQYEFDRECQQRHDTLNDDLATKRKAFVSEVEEFEKRVEDVVARETKVEELEAKVTNIPALIEEAREAAAAEAKKKAETSHGFETRAIKANYDADTKILTNKVEILEEALRNERAANEALQAKLETAYASVENVAKASVEGARTENAVNRVLSTMNEGKK